MRHRGVGRLWLPVLAVAVVLVVWLRTTGTEAAFAVTTGNPGNTFSANADWKPPIISAATVRKAEGGIPGFVRTGGSYTTYASVVDDPSSNPSAGIASVTGNVSTLTAGANALSMSAGAQTVTGVSYTHASSAQTVSAAAGTFYPTVTSTDRATPANTSAAFSFAVTVDNTPPSPSSATTTNASGGTVGQPGTGDTITYAWNEPIDPSSIISGWDGTTSQTVTLQIANKNGNKGDQVFIFNANNTVQLPLGSVSLGNTGYVTTSINFGGPTNATRSTMTWNANGTLTVTLGPPDGGAIPGKVSTPSSTTWAPQSGPYDRAGNLSGTSTVTQSGTTVQF